MTAVGKILVFVNLLFSLVVGGLVTMVYVARTQWSEDFKKLQTTYQIATASEEATRAEKDKIQKELDDLRKERHQSREKVEGDLASAIAETQRLEKELVLKDSLVSKSDAAKSQLDAEVKRREADVREMGSNLKTEREKNIRMALEKQNILERTIKAEIDAKSLKDQNVQLVKALEEKEREIVRMRSSGGAKSTAVAGVNKKNPPAEHVDGLIEAVDPSNGAVVVTLGSDAGLVKGNTLEVFRLNLNTPAMSKHLGTIRIVEVYPNKAVGQPVGRMTAPPQRGDHAASDVAASGGGW
jgi:hypothetical protein